MAKVNGQKQLINKIEVDKAKKLIAEKEKQEIEQVSKEVETFLKTLNDRGFGVVPAGQFVGNQIRAGLQVIKIAKPQQAKK